MSGMSKQTIRQLKRHSGNCGVIGKWINPSPHFLGTK